MTDHDDPDLAVPGTLDRRTLLEKAAIAGGALATAGHPLRPRALGARGGRRQCHFLLEPARPGRRGGGVPQHRCVKGFHGQGARRSSPRSDAEFDNRVKAEARAGKGTVDLLGALHGNFSTLEDKNILLDLYRPR